MSELIEFDPVDVLATGAIGEPGARTFLIQARKNDAQLTVVVEKEQVALLATEASSFLDKLSGEYPEIAVADAPGITAVPSSDEIVAQDDEPLFRARLIGLGFDPNRDLVLIELREQAADDDADEEDETLPPLDPDAAEGYVARLFATRDQVRAFVAVGAAAVAAGRPKCPLCDFPMDPDGHICPRWN